MEESNRIEVGDFVFVPNAVDWVWNPELVVIKDKYKNDGEWLYTANCIQKNMFSFGGSYDKKEITFKENEIFRTRKACQNYISNYYYDGLCRGCKYEKDAGMVFTCGDCEFCKRESSTELERHDIYRCEKCGIIVKSGYGKSHEICKNYKPTLPQYKRIFSSWSWHEDLLKNCEFNQECPFHKNSCHKTCTLERYYNKRMNIPMNFKFMGKNVISVQINRNMWLNQSFRYKDYIFCYSMKFENEKTKSGKVKKGNILAIAFDELQTINITNGKVLVEGKEVEPSEANKQEIIK